MASSVNGKQRVPILFTLTTCSNGRLLIRPSHHCSRSAAPPHLPTSLPHFSPSLSLLLLCLSLVSCSGFVLQLRSHRHHRPCTLQQIPIHPLSLVRPRPRPRSCITSPTCRHPPVSHIANHVVTPVPPPSFPPSLPLGLIRDPDSTSGIDVCRM
jgi:hypothetical protein